MPGLPAEPSSRGTTELRFEMKRGRIEVSAICPPNANCAPPPHLVARAVAEGLRVDVANGQRVPLALHAHNRGGVIRRSHRLPVCRRGSIAAELGVKEARAACDHISRWPFS